VIRAEDVPRLLQLGKRHLFVDEPAAGLVHENDGAARLAAAVAGPGLLASEPREGKVKLLAAHAGVLRVREDAVRAINALGRLACVTQRALTAVQTGDEVAAVRVLPLFVEEARLEQACAAARRSDAVVSVAPPRAYRAGLVITGSEVAEGLVEDAFAPVLRRKLAEFGSTVGSVAFPGDEPDTIAQAIRKQLREGCDLVIATGGMSVDPDDQTPGAIRQVASEVVFQWAPALPGCMSMVATVRGPDGDEAVVLGVPACGAHHERTVLDLLLLRLRAGRLPTAAEAQGWGHGGMCLECETCRFPNCSFGSL